MIIHATLIFLPLRALAAFSRVPMFYYLLQVPLAHVLMIMHGYFTYGSEIFSFVPGSFPNDWEINLGFVCVAWAVVIVLLYPLRVWYAGIKRGSKSWWLSYV